MRFEIALLGPVEARINGDVVGVPAGKQRALLALLAVRAPQTMSAEVAAEALWPRAAPAEAMRNVQVTVSRLRRSLGAAGLALATVTSGYRLAVDGDAVDARRFETLVREARAARGGGDTAAARRLLDDALGLWRGPALADVAFEGFAQPEIARLEELHVAARQYEILDEVIARSVEPGRATAWWRCSRALVRRSRRRWTGSEVCSRRSGLSGLRCVCGWRCTLAPRGCATRATTSRSR